MTPARTLLTVQGPRSRELLSRLTTADLSNEAFPYMRAKEIEVGNGARARDAGDVPGRARLGAAHPDRLRAHGVRRAVRGGRGPRDRATPGSARSTRCDWRRPTATTGSTSTTATRCSTSGSDFTVAWDKPDGFIGRDALVKQRDAGVRTSRMVQVLVKDPEPLLYGDEQLYRDGEHVGRDAQRRLRAHARRQRSGSR